MYFITTNQNSSFSSKKWRMKSLNRKKLLQFGPIQPKQRERTRFEENRFTQCRTCLRAVVGKSGVWLYYAMQFISNARNCRLWQIWQMQKCSLHVPPFSGTWTSTESVTGLVCFIGLMISNVSLSPFPAIWTIYFEGWISKRLDWKYFCGRFNAFL
jgi:hypothetical protein